ncbi:MAG: DNA-binding response regulator [Wenzhouxiangellaceae bacterium]|nr:MAG: DNA-binding response regulator [Wenzhouxiangellaceae bacterium]
MMRKSAGPAVTALVADDHPVVREGLASLLASDEGIEVVATAATGREAADACRHHQPMVALLDLLMPDLDGIEAARLISELSPQTRIIILTSHEGAERFEEAMAAGVVSYLLKTIAPDALLGSIHRTAADEPVLSPELTRSLIRSVRKRSATPVQRLHDALTQREMETLLAIATGRSNAEIALELGVQESTVKTHVSNILGKLQVLDRTQAAVYAWRNKLV